MDPGRNEARFFNQLTLCGCESVFIALNAPGHSLPETTAVRRTVEKEIFPTSARDFERVYQDLNRLSHRTSPDYTAR
jgi:hypothetical protein